MLIDSSIAQAYIESSCVDAFRASWLFEHTSVSSDLGRNAFTPPPEDLALRETVRKLERRICEAAAHFVPVNRPIWDALFPDWEAVQPTLDLIVGYPEPYDAVAAHSPDGQAHLIFDLIRWCNYAELDQLDSIIRNLLTHEITHLLIGHRYPAADAALESTGDRNRPCGLAYTAAYRGRGSKPCQTAPRAYGDGSRQAKAVS